MVLQALTQTSVEPALQVTRPWLKHEGVGVSLSSGHCAL